MSTLVLANEQHYQQINITINNQTPYPVFLTLVYLTGKWTKPFSIGEKIILNPKEAYKNSLISKQKDDDLRSFASMEVAQVTNPHENYLIFAEESSSKKQFISEHIFDGLGSIFVGSVTNHCDSGKTNGYVNCDLTVQTSDHSF